MSGMREDSVDGFDDNRPFKGDKCPTCGRCIPLKGKRCAACVRISRIPAERRIRISVPGIDVPDVR